MSILQQDQIDKLMQRVKELIAAADDLFQRYDPTAVSTHNTSETSHVDIRRTLKEIKGQITESGSANKEYIDQQIEKVNQAIGRVQDSITDFVSGTTTVKNAEHAKTADSATKASTNINGHSLVDQIIKNVAIDNNGTLTITKIDGGTYTIKIKLATTTTDGLMSKTDKVKMDKLVTTNASHTAAGYMTAADKTKLDALTLDEATTAKKGYMSTADKTKLDRLITTNATTTQAGYMSAEDKKKLDKAAEGNTATGSTAGLMSAEDKKKLDALVTNDATTSKKGYMSAADKTKLDKWDGQFVTEAEIKQMASAAWKSSAAKFDSCWHTTKWVVRVNTWCKDNNIPDNLEGSTRLGTEVGG